MGKLNVSSKRGKAPTPYSPKGCHCLRSQVSGRICLVDQQVQTHCDSDFLKATTSGGLRSAPNRSSARSQGSNRHAGQILADDYTVWVADYDSRAEADRFKKENFRFNANSSILTLSIYSIGIAQTVKGLNKNKNWRYWYRNGIPYYGDEGRQFDMKENSNIPEGLDYRNCGLQHLQNPPSVVATPEFSLTLCALHGASAHVTISHLPFPPTWLHHHHSGSFDLITISFGPAYRSATPSLSGSNYRAY